MAGGHTAYSPHALGRFHHHSCRARGRPDRLNAGQKFIGQPRPCWYVIWGGRIEFVSNPFGDVSLDTYLRDRVLILALINLMNLSTGRWLAVGISLIAAPLCGVWRDLGRMEAAAIRILVGSVLVFCLSTSTLRSCIWVMRSDAAGSAQRWYPRKVRSKERLPRPVRTDLDLALPIVTRFAQWSAAFSRSSMPGRSEPLPPPHAPARPNPAPSRICGLFPQQPFCLCSLVCSGMLGQLTSWCL